MEHFIVFTDGSFDDANEYEMRLLYDKETNNGTNPRWWGQEGRYNADHFRNKDTVWTLSKCVEKRKFSDFNTLKGIWEDEVVEVRVPKPLPSGTKPSTVWDFYE